MGAASLDLAWVAAGRFDGFHCVPASVSKPVTSNTAGASLAICFGGSGIFHAVSGVARRSVSDSAPVPCLQLPAMVDPSGLGEQSTIFLAGNVWSVILPNAAVLGGTEVFRHGDFQGDGVQNTLLADQEIEANARGVNPRTIGVPDLRGGAQRLDVRFIQFDNVVIELLQYRDADQPMGSAKSFAEPVQHMSPAFPRMMHICFYVRDDVDFNKFIADLEAESARRGMTQVRANRTVRVMTEADRKAAPRSANTNRVTEAPSDGWELIYCKGPEGEQLEFVKALGPVKKRFSEALSKRQQKIVR